MRTKYYKSFKYFLLINTNYCNKFITFAKMRTIYRSMEFDLFYNSLSNKVQNKQDYALNIISEIKIINSKLAKKLKNTNLYELRFYIENEYRIILFTIDHESLIESNEVILLNGFIKKSTKDYKKEIHKAQRILNSLT